MTFPQGSSMLTFNKGKLYRNKIEFIMFLYSKVIHSIYLHHLHFLHLHQKVLASKSSTECEIGATYRSKYLLLFIQI